MVLSLESNLIQDTPLLQSLRDEQLGVLFEMTFDAIAIVDQEGRFLDVNRATCQLWGLARPELIGQSLRDFVGDNLDAQRWQALQPSEQAQGQWQLQYPNGTKRIVQYRVIPQNLSQDLPECLSLSPSEYSNEALTQSLHPPLHSPLQSSLHLRYLLIIQDVTDRPSLKASIDLLHETNLLDTNDNKLLKFEPDLQSSTTSAEEKFNRLQLALQVANIGVWDWNPQTNEVNFSSQWKAILGYEEDEIKHELIEWESRVHPDDLQKVYAQIGRHLQGELSFYQTEHRLRCKDGTYKWIVDRGRIAARDEQGKPIQFIGINYDISERKRSEIALEKLSQQLKKSQEIAHLGHWSLNLETQQLTCSEEFFRLLEQDLTLEQPSFDRYIEQLHPDDRSIFAQRLAAAQNGISQDFGYRILRNDGVVRYLDTRIEPEIKDGTVIRLFGIVMDISDRKVAENELKETNILLNSLIETIPGLFFAKDRQGRHLALNSNLANFFGRSISNILNKTDAELFPPEVAQKIMKKDQKIMINGIYERFEEIVPNNGQDCTYLTIKMPLRNDLGDVIGIIGLAQDISDRKAIEVALADKAEALEQAMQEIQRTQLQMIQSEKMSSLGQLVAGVAHEINNPVSFIYGNINPANEYTQDLLDLLTLYQIYYPNPIATIQNKVNAIDLEFIRQDLPKLLASMKMGAERITQIVASLRNFSRLDESDYKCVDIHEGIDSTLVILDNRFRAIAGRPAIQLMKQYDDLPLIECYAGQLNQVFINILTNALDALEEADRDRSNQELHAFSSSIQIITEKISHNRVAIHIIDNGPGIPEAVKQRIFDPFFTTKPIGKGTGMGMSLSYQIITEKHKGTLSCDSTIGQGTKFTIEIPICQV